MDGRQGSVKRGAARSLQFRLSLWLSLVILGVAIVAGALAFVAAFREAIEAQDDQLKQFAALIDRLQLPPTAFDSKHDDDDTDDDARIVVQPLSRDSAQAPSGRGKLRNLPTDLGNGFQTVRMGHHSWRVFVKPLRSGERVAVGQRTDFRDDIASASAWHTVAPLVLLIPVLLLLVALLVRGALKPLKGRAAEIDRRAEQDLSAVESADLPAEIRPFVVAINRLLARVAEAMETQRRFVADAAHELRTPITALSLQAERASEAPTLQEAGERLATLRNGLRRTRQLLDQLLALARAQSVTAGEAPLATSLRVAVRHVVEDLMPLADAKRIDLGVEGDADALVGASEVDLRTLVGNLVENAIRYAPAGGRVSLSIDGTANRAALIVEDNGPGIEPAERERVFDPFYRVLGSGEAGSGLGLSIVRTIAERIGARVRLDAAAANSGQNAIGLRVTVTFGALPRSQ
ncbi:MAG: HAMP domain-containing sensor histidine kinase [Burkholderiales bacterium]